MAGLVSIHVLHCGYIRVSEAVPYGNSVDLKSTGKQLLTPDRRRLTLPVCVYLIEHPHGLILVDAGWCRAISPQGVYDPRAVERVLPRHMAALFHPWLPEGAGIHEQLAARGLRPEDLDLGFEAAANRALLCGFDHTHILVREGNGTAFRAVALQDE